MKNLIVFILIIIACSCNVKTKTTQNQDSVKWEAQWISAGENVPGFDTTYPAPFFRKTFNIDKEVISANAKVTGVGYFEFYLNGEKIGDQLLAPSFTRYDKRVKYLEFDITNNVHTGQNVAGSILGNGFYNVDTRSAWDFVDAPWRSRPAFICEITLEYKNGRQNTIISDDSWKFSTGPILFDQIRNGENYDANKELSGWLTSDYDDSGWANAHIVSGPGGMLSKEEMPPIKKTKILHPKKITETKDGAYLVDFGQNISGWAKIKVNEEKGQKVTLRYGERIFEDGTLDQKELSRFIFTGETQTTNYISNGKADQAYEPRFTYFGFQYIQVEGLTEPLKSEDIEAYMINTAFDTVGYFECSNQLLNKIHENIQWSFLGNYHGFPEDCPHREKMGWTGDAQLVVETGLFNFDAFSAYRKFIQDHVDEQQESGDLPGIIPTSGWGYKLGRNSNYGYGPHWEGSAIVLPWHLYRHSADVKILEEFYPMMKKYLLYLESISEDNLLNFGIDDHKSIVTHTEGGYISSAYYSWLSDIMSQVATILNFDEEAAKFTSMKENSASAFHQKYFNQDAQTYGNGGQTQMSLALACGIVPDEFKESVFGNLLQEIERTNYHFDCGVVGLRKLIDVLMAFDRKDVLYKMANQKDFPSFGYWIKLGANTMWQNWDGSQSRNHIMFGSIGDYFYYGLAGINIDAENLGFKRILIAPQFPDDMSYLKCGHKTAHGWIKIDWQKEGSSILYKLVVPEGTEAEFKLSSEKPKINLNGEKIDKTDIIKIVNETAQTVTLLIPPGSYEFEIEI